jgi:competence protein ComEC
MKSWQRYPFLRIFIPFVVGIVIGIYSGIPFITGMWIIILIVPFLFVFHYFQLRTLSFGQRYIQGLFVIFISICLGLGITGLHNHRTESLHFANRIGLTGLYKLRIEDVPSYKTKTVRLQISILSGISNNKEVACNGRVMAYFQSDSNSTKLRYGDVVIARLILIPVEPPMNPNSFDYKKYLSYQGIYHRTYIASSEWVLLKKAEGFNIYRLGTSLQEKFINLFKIHKPNSNELSVASALVLGYGNNIEPELINAYTTTGTLHILSVSGLHVGVIYLVLSVLLISLKRKTYTRIFRGVILLAVVWFYALITGLSPAVLRSAAMLSFIIVGECFEREPNTINTLAASAFILLVIDPFQLMNIGFQLSYLSVAGIVLIHPLVNNLWKPRFKIAQLIWGLTTVSIAAQLASSPLSLYYFHQFPNYFIFTNYIAIPLSSVAIYAGMLTLITSPLVWVSHQMALFFFGSVALLNHCILFFGQLPYAAMKNIRLSIPETLAIYTFIFMIYLIIIQERKKIPLFCALCCLLFIGTYSFTDNLKNNQQQTVIIYSVNKNSVIEYYSGHNGLSVQSSFPVPEDQSFIYQIKGNRIACGIRQIRKTSLYQETLKDAGMRFWKSGPCYLFNQKRLIVQNGNLDRVQSISVPVATDYLLLTNNPFPDIETLLSRYRFKQVILDASNSPYTANKWKKLCNDNRIPCHYTASDGAYIFNTD